MILALDCNDGPFDPLIRPTSSLVLLAAGPSCGQLGLPLVSPDFLRVVGHSGYLVAEVTWCCIHMYFFYVENVIYILGPGVFLCCFVS